MRGRPGVWERVGAGRGGPGGGSPAREPCVWLPCASCVRSHPSLQGAVSPMCPLGALCLLLNALRDKDRSVTSPVWTPPWRASPEPHLQRLPGERGSVSSGNQIPALHYPWSPRSRQPGHRPGWGRRTAPPRSLTLVSLGHRPQDPGSHPACESHGGQRGGYPPHVGP